MRDRLSGAASVLILGLLCPRILAAQYNADLAPASFQELQLGGSDFQGLRLGNADDYRYEGALIGGVVLGLGGALLVGGLCSSSDSSDNCGLKAIEGGVLLGALGALSGALIGGLFPKRREL